MAADKSVIITGANSGLGFACAGAIAKANKGWHIVIACRDTQKGDEARQKLVRETGNKEISVLALDLASLQAIRDFVGQFRGLNLPPLRGLINNAGIQVMQGVAYTKDGYELTFGTNHLGHFLLTNLLLDQFTAPARIVVVSSGTHDPDTIEGRFNKPVFLGANQLANPKGEKEMAGMQRYSTSKLANMLFAYELARRLKVKRVTVNAFDPAAVPETNLLRSVENPTLRSLVRASLSAFKFLGVVTSTAEASGDAMARLLLGEKLENVTGKYFQVNEEKRSSTASYDESVAAQLWHDSAVLTGLD